MALTNGKHPGETLQRRIAGLLAVEREIVGARNRLSLELGRYASIHEFSARAMKAHAPEALESMAASALADLFDLDFGCAWLFDEAPQGSYQPSAISGVARMGNRAWGPHSGSGSTAGLPRTKAPIPLPTRPVH